MKIRLIASDLDDTLLNGQSQLSPRTLRALDAARERGCQVSFVSGRMACAMKGFMEQAHISAPCVAYNGGALVDPDTFAFIEETPIPPEIARKALRFAEDMGLHAQVYVNDVCYSQRLDETALAYAQAAHLTPGIHVRAAGMKLSEFLTRGTTKMLIIDDPVKVGELSRELNRRFGDSLSCGSSRPRYLEIVLKASNKGVMLGRLAGRLGVDLGEVAAFGDGQNDLPMMSIAGYGCCVENAHPDVKAVSPHMCPSNREDGVAQAIEKMIEDGWIGGKA